MINLIRDKQVIRKPTTLMHQQWKILLLLTAFSTGILSSRATAGPIVEIKNDTTRIGVSASINLENGGTQTLASNYFGPTIDASDLTQRSGGSAIVGANILDAPGADQDDKALAAISANASSVVEAGRFHATTFAKASRSYGDIVPRFPTIDGVTALQTADVFSRYTVRILEEDVAFYANVFSGGQRDFLDGSYYAPVSLRVVNRTTGQVIATSFIDDARRAEDVIGILEAGNTYSVHLRTRIVDTAIGDFDDEEPEVIFNIETDRVKVPTPSPGGLMIMLFAIGMLARKFSV
ncbi:MAG: hypothetical protein AAF004_05385 [Pseudomonadota bacterium]